MKSFSIKLFRKMTTWIFALAALKVDDRLVYFESFHAKQWSDNPKGLYEYLKENHPELKLVWGVKKGYEQVFIDNHVPYVRRFSLRWYLTMPRAKYWIINTRTPLWIPKSSKNIYIQTWHGTPLKKLGKDIKDVRMPGTNTLQYRESFKNESQRWDYFVVPNTFSEHVLKNAFSYDGKTINKGYPRTDELIQYKNDVQYIMYLKEKLNIPQDKKVILYAPTWRDNEYFSVGNYRFKEGFSFNEFDHAFGSDVVLLLRMHYLVSEGLDLSNFNGRIIDVSGYENINDLMLVSDLLITDYSSLFVEFALLNKPIYFYMYDKETYVNDIRGFYEALFNDLPGTIIEKEEALFEALQQSIASSLFTEHHKAFNEKYNKENDGHAAMKIWTDIQKHLFQ